MITAFASPSTYVQDDQLLTHAAPYIAPFGDHGMLLTDDNVWQLVGATFYQNLTDAGLTIAHVTFNGESSPEEIDRIKAIGERTAAKFVMALGGGKTNDTTPSGFPWSSCPRWPRTTRPAPGSASSTPRLVNS